MATQTRRNRPIATRTATHAQIDHSIRRHSMTLGPDQEHLGETVPGCVGCQHRVVKGEAAHMSRQDADARPLVYRTSRNVFVALDLAGPFVDIVDALLDAGLSDEQAEDEAWRLVQ